MLPSLYRRAPKAPSGWFPQSSKLGIGSVVFSRSAEGGVPPIV